jgi:hypothetical protein
MSMNWTRDGLVETMNPANGSLGELKTAGSFGFKLDANIVPLPAVPRIFWSAVVQGDQAGDFLPRNTLNTRKKGCFRSVSTALTKELNGNLTV